MQSALRSCFELQAWVFRVQTFRESCALALPWLNTFQRRKLLPGSWHLQRSEWTFRERVGVEPYEQQLTLRASALSLNNPLLSTRRCASRPTFFSNQDFSRPYNVQPEPDITHWPLALRQRLDLLCQQAISDDELRAIWRDILESFGDGGPGLPVTGSDADKIWCALISLGTRDEIVMQELCQYCDRLWDRERRERTTFYADALASLIKNKKHSAAVALHGELGRKMDIGPEDLLKIFYNGCSTSDDLETFQKIYSASPKLRLHDPLVGHLCDQLRMADALEMHEFFMNRHDYPKDVSILQQLHVFYASRGPSAAESFRKRLAAAGIGVFDKNASPGSASGLSDDFTARLFATHTFSTPFIANWLVLFGSTRLGPLATKELCSRTRTVNKLADSLQILSARGIYVGKRVLRRIIERIINQEDQLLLDGIISSEHHLDALEDAEWQKQQLIHQHRHQSHSQMYFTRAILSEHGFDVVESQSILLMDDIQTANWTRASKTLANLAEKKLPLSDTVVSFFNDILGQWQYDSKNVQDARGAINFATSLWWYIVKTKKIVPMDFWRKCAIPMVTAGRLSDLERLVFLLASERFDNRQRAKSIWTAILKRTSNDWDGINPTKAGITWEGGLNRVFTMKFQAHLLLSVSKAAESEWFAAGDHSLAPEVSSQVLATDRWLFGVRLLHTVKHKFGVYVPDKLVRNKVAYGLRRLVRNERSLYHNPRWMLANRLARETNEIWGVRLLPESEQDLYDDILGLYRNRPRPSLEPASEDEMALDSA